MPKDIDEAIEVVKKNFEVLSQSAFYSNNKKNVSSKYGRVYLDVEPIKKG